MAALADPTKIYDFPPAVWLQWRVMFRLSDPLAIIELAYFSILPHRRQLLAEGRPIRLDGRAFDLPLALLEAPGAVVGVAGPFEPRPARQVSSMRTGQLL